MTILDYGMSDTNETIYTVSQLNRAVRDFLEQSFLPLWITGEISNFACPSSGHWYFSLKDAGASVRCAMFAGKNRGLGFKPENGMQIMLKARVSLYEGRGEFQLIAEQMEPAGDGLLQKKFEALKQKLNAEGLFAQEHKKPLPDFPKTIGVVTSPTGAAIRDIITVLNRRFPAIHIIIYPASVQGTQASSEITRAIEIANERNECDVLIVGRGGGSLEDLWPFNEENVARAIFTSRLPVVSAVGHEIDFTISDFVADVRAATPSAAAELVSPDQQSLLHTLARFAERLRHPLQKLREQMQLLDDLEQRLIRAIKNILERVQQRLMHDARTLNTLSPLATLDRGYAILLNDQQHVIDQCQKVTIGETVTAKLKNGKLYCRVDKIDS